MVAFWTQPNAYTMAMRCDRSVSAMRASKSLVYSRVLPWLRPSHSEAASTFESTLHL